MSLYPENTPQKSPAQEPQFKIIRELDPVKVQELQEPQNLLLPGQKKQYRTKK